MKSTAYPRSQQLKLSAIAAAVVFITFGFVGCGGSDSAAPVVAGPSGKVVDGYVSGASLWADKDKNGSCETDSGKKTDALGNYSLDASFNGFTLCAKGGTDISTNLPLVGELHAPAGATQITPLTTLVVALIEADKVAGKTTTAAEAAATVATKLGLGSIDVLTTDPFAPTVSTPKLGLTTVAIQTLLVNAASGVAQAATGLPATSAQTAALYSSAVAGVSKAVAAAAANVDLTPISGTSGGTALETQAIQNTVASVQANPAAAATVPGIASLVPATVASTITAAVNAAVSVAMSTTTSSTAAPTTTTSTTAAPTTTTSSTAAPTTSTVASTSSTAAATTSTTAATTSTTAVTTSTTARPTTTTSTAAPTTTTTAAPTTTTTAAPTTTTTTTTTTLPVVVKPALSLAATATNTTDLVKIGTNDAVNLGAAYAGPPVQFGPYTVTGLTASTNVTMFGPLSSVTTIKVNSGAAATTGSVVNGDAVTLFVDMASYATNVVGGPLSYNTTYSPKIKAGAVIITWGSSQGGGILTCGDPTVPPSVGNSVCQ